MGLIEVLVAVLVVVLVYLVAEWVLSLLKINIPNELLKVGAILLLLLILLGRVNIGL